MTKLENQEAIAAAQAIGPRTALAILTRNRRMMDGAANYAAAEKSDPFAYARALAHIRTGIAGLTRDDADAFYKAEPFQEERLLPDGASYFATVYRNVQRP